MLMEIMFAPTTLETLFRTLPPLWKYYHCNVAKVSVCMNYLSCKCQLWRLNLLYDSFHWCSFTFWKSVLIYVTWVDSLSCVRTSISNSVCPPLSCCVWMSSLWYRTYATFSKEWCLCFTSSKVSLEALWNRCLQVTVRLLLPPCALGSVAYCFPVSPVSYHFLGAGFSELCLSGIGNFGYP